MNLYDQPGPKSLPGENDEILSLSSEWIAKLERAYDRYRYERLNFTRIIAIYASLFMAVYLGVGSLIIWSRQFEVIYFRFIEGFVVLGTGLIALVVFVFSFDAWRRYRYLLSLRDDLQDLHGISTELLHMTISSMERSAGSKYESLVIHLRVLEVRHLLAKVERAIRRKPFGPF